MSSILVIEDSAFTRRRIVQTLTQAGHHVIEADNGRTGLTLAQEHQTDAIFLDLLMPEMDGVDVLRCLKEQNNQTPIVVLSADIQDTTRQVCLALGASYFMGKPPREEELLDVLNNVLCLA